MFSWTSAYKGRPFGCCAGKGAYEDCLEQHITPDVAFSFMQYFHATGDVAWLNNTGYAVVEGIADWVVSRVSANADGSYSIRRVLPIDEWCDEDANECLTQGIDDDAQMNAVSRLALEFAIEAAAILGRFTAFLGTSVLLLCLVFSLCVCFCLPFVS